MQKSLLAHIASNFISEYENVANSSIAYLLNEYTTVREALKNILGIDEVPTHYITELSTKSNGRPDVTGLDIDGNKAVIIEGKFWANLTKNQPNNYLKELTDTGKLLFLVPNKRVNSLELEISSRLNPEDSRIIVYSWNNFLDLVEVENNKNHNTYLASDLNQLNDLCQRMDTEGMPPLSMSDLSPMNGRILSHFSDVVDECNPILRKWKHANFKGTQTTSKKYGHGFYFYAYDFTCFLCFDSSEWFRKDCHTPIWLYIWDDEWKESEKIIRVLKTYDIKNSYGEAYGVVLQTGMDKNQVVNHIVNKTKEVLRYLNENL